MKKVWRTLILITAFVFVLAGCQKDDEKPAGDNAPAATDDKASSDDAKDDSADSYTVNSGQLAIGTEGTYSPYSFHDETDKLTGFDVEIAEAVAEYLGLEAVFVEAKWDSLVAGLDVDQYDVVVNQVTITDERLAKYAFSVPYTYTHAGVVVAEDNDEIKSYEDLDGKKAAQTVTSNWAATAEEYGAELVGTDGFSESVELVLTGRADLTMNDDVTFYDFITQKPDAGVKLGFTGEEALESAIILKQDNEELQKKLDEALQALKENGTLEEISNKYFGKNVTEE